MVEMSQFHITFEQSIEGYLLDANARQLSEHTILDYTRTFKKFQRYLERNHLGDLHLNEITSSHIKEFLAGLTGLSKKTIYNYHIGLSALWTWAKDEGLVDDHIVRSVNRPKPEKPDIIPYTQNDIQAFLTAARNPARPVINGIDYRERNITTIFVLLDTGIRASELGSLKIKDVDLQNNRLSVWGKGSKERTIPFSSKTGKQIWRWLTQRPEDTFNDHLLITSKYNPMSSDVILEGLQTIGEAAKVTNVTVHRFRHTFAINFLRNGGDVYSLQRILGHSTLQMVRRYLKIAQVDVDKAHKKASPVANWRL
jgi:site-specific recombinase XerD